MRYPTVLFDLDHTLLDSDTSLRLAFDEALGDAGLDEPASHYDTFDAINRALWKRVEAGALTPPQVGVARFERLVATLDLDADPIALSASYAAALGRHGELYPGAMDVLDTLAGLVTLALVTNGLSEVQRARIDRLGIAGHFDAVVISAEVGVAKPAPAIFDLAFDALGRPAREGTVMVGDNMSSDIAGGAGYGLATCWYNPDGLDTDELHLVTHEIDELAALPPLILGV